MRVRGSGVPVAVSVEATLDGYAEVRLRENVKEISSLSPMGAEEEVKLYEYDEYVIKVPMREGLEDEVKSHLSEWIATGRSLEFNERSTIAMELKEAGARQVKAYVQANNEPTADSGIFAVGFDLWESGKQYEKGDLFVYNGDCGYVKQAHTSQSDWIPFTVGTESLYGARPVPEADGVYPYVYNMAADEGMRVRENGEVYICYNPIPDMLYPPSQLAAHFKKEGEA